MNFNPESIIAIGVFLIGSTCAGIVSCKYANIFKNDPKEAGITFVSGHFLALFVVPFVIVAATTLSVLGKFDAGVSGIIGMIIGFIIQKVTIR